MGLEIKVGDLVKHTSHYSPQRVVYTVVTHLEENGTNLKVWGKWTKTPEEALLIPPWVPVLFNYSNKVEVLSKFSVEDNLWD